MLYSLSALQANASSSKSINVLLGYNNVYYVVVFTDFTPSVIIPRLTPFETSPVDMVTLFSVKTVSTFL